MIKKQPRNLLADTLKFLTLIAIEGFAAAAWLLLIPKSSSNAEFLGYSFERLALLVPILGLAALAGFLRLALKTRPNWQAALENKKTRVDLSRWGIVLSFLLALFSWTIPFFVFFLLILDDIGAYVRLLPVFVYAFMVGMECIVFIALNWLDGTQKNGEDQKVFFFKKPFWIIAGLLILIWSVIELTGLGKAPEFVSIISLGVPLLEGQIWYMAGLVGLILCLTNAWTRLPRKEGQRTKANLDLIICVLLWVLAAVLWLSLPLPNNSYFAPRQLPPNNTVYPFSDAAQYDMNSLWVWKGSIKDIVISKPLYVSFLALVHALVGLDYEKVILAQTLVLALLPAVLYLIGKEMHSRLGGVLLGMFAIFREMNSIQAINFANVSNSKLLLSDLPATLVVCVLVLTVIRWLKSDDAKIGLRPFIIGGLVGCLNLMRIQTMLLEPFFILVFIIRYRKNFKKILQACAIFTLAVALIIGPVLIRNHSITGVYWLDNPTASSSLYRFFLSASDEELEIPQAASEEQMLNRNISVISQIISKNLGTVVYMSIDNFMRNFISTVLIFPVRAGNGIGLLDYLQIRDPFWMDVYSQANIRNALVVLFNLIMISFGMAAVGRKNSSTLIWILGFYCIYSSSSALVRLSGWRFIMPVDWLSMAFFAFGMVDGGRWLASRLVGWDGIGNEDDLTGYQTDVPASSFTWKPALAFGITFLLIGAFISIRENLLPVNYPELSQAEVCTTIQKALDGSRWEDQSTELYEFCLREDVKAFAGVGIYPRLFNRGEGYYKRNYDPYFGIQDYRRLVFRTVGDPNGKVFIKTDEKKIQFPDGALVYVVGEDVSKFEARVVLIDGEKPQLIVSSGDFSEAAESSTPD